MAYVDTEKLKRNIRVNLMPNVDADGTVTVENAERYFLNLIEKTSTANVVEVKRGKWKIKRDDYDCEYMVCSCCKEEFYPVDADTVDTTPNFCMNCGADMRGGKE